MNAKPVTLAIIAMTVAHAVAAVDPRLAKPFIEHDHFGTPDWKAVRRVKPDGPFPALSATMANAELMLTEWGDKVTSEM